MLKQLSRLSIEADGRYATDAELKFLRDYLESAEQRIKAYEKIRDVEEKVADQVAAKGLASDPYLFTKGSQDYSAICKRDRRSVLRISATAMLTGDLDTLRNSFLCWYRTIIKAFNDQRAAKVTYKLLPEMVNQHLSAEEAALIRPALELSRSILTEQA